MENISLFNKNGQNFMATAIRYFEVQGNKYFIFHINEVDEQEYIKLYASKIVQQDGKFYTYPIDDENEWNAFKNEIYKIVLNNRKNIPNNNDLDVKKLNGMFVSNFKLFKLKKETSEELGKNIIDNSKTITNSVDVKDVPQPVMPTQTVSSVQSVVSNPVQQVSPEINEYKEKYEKLLSDYENLKSENLKLIDLVASFNKKIIDIKNIIA